MARLTSLTRQRPTWWHYVAPSTSPSSPVSTLRSALTSCSRWNLNPGRRSVGCRCSSAKTLTFYPVLGEKVAEATIFPRLCMHTSAVLSTTLSATSEISVVQFVGSWKLLWLKVILAWSITRILPQRCGQTCLIGNLSQTLYQGKMREKGVCVCW